MSTGDDPNDPAQAPAGAEGGSDAKVPARKIPPLLLEKLLLSELTPEDERVLRARIDADPEAAKELEAMRRSNDEILRALPPARFAQRIASALEPKDDRPWLSRLGIGLIPAAVAAAALLVVLSEDRAPAPSVPIEDTRQKGLSPHLVVHRLKGREAERLVPGAEVRPGDLLQLAYVAGGKAYGMIVSVDGRGQSTLHLGGGNASVQKLEPRGTVPLPFAYELDDAPSFERFFFVVSDAPFEEDRVMRAVSRLALSPEAARKDPLALDPDLEQASFLVTKPAAP